MKNEIQIQSDAINIYATIFVKASKTGIRILTLLIASELILFVILLTKIEIEEIFSMIIPFILVLIFMIGIPIKYLLWNKFGEEFLIVSAKSVSWSYDYGIIKTNIKTEIYDRLGLGFEKVRSDGENDFGRLIFYNYRKHDDLPVIIHQTAALLTSSEIEELIDKILNMFAPESKSESSFIPISDN